MASIKKCEVENTYKMWRKELKLAHLSNLNFHVALTRWSIIIQKTAKSAHTTQKAETHKTNAVPFLITHFSKRTHTNHTSESGGKRQKVMALRASSAVRPPSLQLSPPQTPPKSVILPPKVNSLSLPATAILPLFALFAAPHEARAEILPKEQIVSSLTQVGNSY